MRIISVRDQIASYLRHRILSGELAPGTRLREVPLAKELGISRGPIRDAFLSLTKEGLLTEKANVGARVATRPSAFKRNVIVRMRREIECASLDAWFTEGNPDLLSELEENLAVFRQACVQGELQPVVETDMAFHRLLVASADGGSLVDLWEPVILQMFLRYSRHRSLLESHTEHAAIVSAMHSGDRSLAIRNLKAHIV